MSSPAEIAPGMEPHSSSPSPAWHVRSANSEDVEAVATAAAELLSELGGDPPARSTLVGATRALIEDESAGAVLVADTGKTLIGVLAASWQTAIHVPGRYGLIQDLWVAPQARSQSVGAALLAALCEIARTQGVTRIEVGLPRESFASLPATQAFYEREDFSLLGPRMRRMLV